MYAHSRAARIGARIRAHLASPDWAWRYSSTAPIDEYDAAALATLRGQCARARRWLELWSARIGMDLPAGNGSGGPWHRVAVLDSSGRVGLLDIAAGRIAWTDSVSPSYVRRFAIAIDRAAHSPNPAGGSGAAGSATAQVALTYHMHPREQPRLAPLPRPRVAWIEYGLTTCYGHVADPPSVDDWRSEWARLVADGVECRETALPQWERVAPPIGRCTVEVAEAVRCAYPLGYLPAGARIEVRDGGWSVYGTAADRAAVIPRLLAVHAAVAREIVAHATISAQVEAGLIVDSVPAGGGPLASSAALKRIGRDALKRIGRDALEQEED